jgi:hypothetical protein
MNEKNMKDLFPGYFKKSKETIKKIWDNGIFYFDTNILLNLYRYSDSTQESLMDVLEKYKNRIFLPHQSALEFNKNRIEVIYEQIKIYKEFQTNINKIQAELKSNNKHPFLKESINVELDKVFSSIQSDVIISINKYEEYLNEDPIYDRISSLFSGKISEPFTIEKLKEIYKLGEDRFKSFIPPGFRDKNKENNNKYGDLVLWFQIIESAKMNKKDVIFITDEQKDDWIWKLKDGKSIGPRQELVEELKKEANVELQFYSTENFLKFASDSVSEKVDAKALDEIRTLQEIELENDFSNENAYKFENIKSHKSYDLNSNRELLKELNLIDKELAEMISFRKKSISETNNNEHSDEFSESLNKYQDDLLKRREYLLSIYEKINNNKNPHFWNQFRKNLIQAFKDDEIS